MPEIPIPSSELILAVHAAATLAMVGVIWFVQLVHYPLYDRVGAAGFVRYERAHMWRTSLVVMPLMGAEALTAAWLLWRPPAGVPQTAIQLASLLLAAIWLSTFTLQAPRHGRLARGYDASVHRSLVATNWIRTVAWSVRGVLVLWMAARVMA